MEKAEYMEAHRSMLVEIGCIDVTVRADRITFKIPDSTKTYELIIARFESMDIFVGKLFDFEIGTAKSDEEVLKMKLAAYEVSVHNVAKVILINNEASATITMFYKSVDLMRPLFAAYFSALDLVITSFFEELKKFDQ